MPAIQRQVVATESQDAIVRESGSLETTMTTIRLTRAHAHRLSRSCAILLAVPLLTGLPAEAKVFSKFLDADKFGQLDQAKTGCKATGCGPTAAVNSFMFLQNSYPDVYGEKLIPPTTAGQAPTEADLIKVANKVGSDFMKSCTPCGPNDGTYIEDFIVGKRDYLESVAPGKTRYQAQIDITWRFGTDKEPADAANKGAAKPAFVTDATKPTLDFLYRNIDHGEDVELFLGGHYITLTGIEYDDATNLGKIAFIDPLGGAKSQSKITGITGGFITLDYETSSSVFAAVVESPVPEPGAWVLLLSGVGVILFRVRRDGSALTKT